MGDTLPLGLLRHTYALLHLDCSDDLQKYIFRLSNSQQIHEITFSFYSSSLEVEAGQFSDSEILVMLGENGTGKTTFIRMMAGKLEPDSGSAEIPSLNISYKPQKISPKSQNTVQHLLHEKIRDFYIHPQFIADVMRPLMINELIDQEVRFLVTISKISFQIIPHESNLVIMKF